MAECILLKGCLFFNDKMPDNFGLGAIYKKRYCLADSSQCARYRVAEKVGREKVPQNLYPNMFDKIESIIASV